MGMDSADTEINAACFMGFCRQRRAPKRKRDGGSDGSVHTYSSKVKGAGSLVYLVLD